MSDHVVRAITDDGSFRTVTARADRTARDAIEAQRAAGAAASLFAELVAGAVLFRETMAPTMRVQCILDGAAGSGHMVVDAYPSGDTRGLVGVADGFTSLDLGAGAILRMSRALAGGRLHEGVVRCPPERGLAQALESYLQESEQVVSVVGVAAVGAGDDLRAGGWVVQLLPEVDRSMLAVMTERLTDFPTVADLLRDDASPRRLVDELFHGMQSTTLDESPIRFRCGCSRERAARALATVGRDEVVEAVAENRSLETDCQFCRSSYVFEPTELGELLLAPGDGAGTVH